MTSGSTFGWAATETGNFAESTPATGELNLTPKRGGTYVDVSTQALIQMQPSVAALVMDDLMMAVELGIDLAYFHGTGASGQPTGLALTSGIGSFGGPTIQWEGVVEAETDIEVANADIGTMAFATTPAVKAVFKTRLKSSVGTTGFIADPDGSVNGFPVGVSNQISAGYAFFGVFSQSAIPMWGATEIVYDDKSLRVGGLVRFLIEAFIDVGIRRAGAYTLSTGTN
jgi:HK97 family phage major capsid protein